MSVMDRQATPSSVTRTGLDALRNTAGWMRLRETGWIAVSGDDRVRWLNGMVTNSVQALTPGEGAYTFLLNAQGRIQGDATVWCEAGRLLLETDLAQVEPMMALLDRFIIMDDVELHDQTGAMHGVAIAGPVAADVLSGLGMNARRSRLLKRVPLTWRDNAFVLINAYSPVVPRMELWTDDETSLTQLTQALAAVMVECRAEDFALLRVLEAVPRFGADIRDRDLPQETAQTRALHFNKGCYLGQEIVERIRSRGQVHRTFTAFRLIGDAPSTGTELIAEGKPVGALTSVAAERIDGERIALGYIRREVLERGLPIAYAEGIAEARPAPSASND